MLTRLRNEFFDIRPREWPTALGLSSFFFLVIAIFWVLKPIKRGALIGMYASDPLQFMGLQFSGAEAEQLGKVLNMIVVYGLVVGYTWLVRRYTRLQMIMVLCAMLSGLLAVFAFLVDDPSAPTVWSFYVFGDMFNSLMVVTFWAFANDVTRPEQSKRLYGIVGLGGVIGGFVGATFVRAMVEDAGRAPLLLACVGAMVAIAAITYFVHRREGGTPSAEATEKPSYSASAAIEGARLVFASKYLLAILGIIGLYEIVSNIVDFQLAAIVETSIQDEQARDAFFGLVGQITGIGSIVVQLLVTSFVMKRYGVGVALLFLPISILFGSVGFLLVPSLVFVVAMSASDNALNYSINQSAREALYTPTTREIKYKAKAFIDMFVQRFAKVIAVVLNLAFAAYVGVQDVRWLSIAVIFVLVAWIAIVRYAGRQFEAKAAENASIPAQSS
jgi:AAA family ATP:ADP antiporter